jgi:hypothetical protein
MKIHKYPYTRKKLMPGISIFLFFLFNSLNCFGQNRENLMTVSEKNKFSVTAGVSIPVGQFANTHSLGFGAVFGRAPVYKNNQPVKFNFTYNGGVSFFTGKNEKVSGYEYRYPSYLFFHAFAGLSYNLSSTANLSLTAGPGLGLYNKTSSFNLGSTLIGNYFFSDKFGIGTGLLLMKESKANPLLSLMLQGIIVF